MFRRAQRPPAPPPAPRFEPVPVPDLLRVPSAVPADAAAPPDWLPAGTPVAAGERLTAATSQAVAPAVAPVAGVLGRPAVVRLTDGRSFHAVELWPTPPGRAGDGGEADADDADLLAPLSPPPDEAVAALARAGQADLGSWLDRLVRLGVAADRWASPDLAGQLRHALRRPVDTVVCALLDSDPWLGLSRAVAAAFPREVAAGIGLLGRVTAAKHVWALVDQAEPDVSWDGLRAAAGGRAGEGRQAGEPRLARDLRVAPIENDYPQPDPTLLVYAAARRRLRPGHLPTEQGVLLVDAAAAAAVGRAALTGRPAGRVPVVVYDQPADAGRALAVVPGTTVGAVLAFLGIPAAVRELYAGSPLRQLRARPTDVIGAGELTLFAAPPQPHVPAAPCIGCGWCVEGCPTGCRPAGLLEAAQREDIDLGRRNGLDACIECGLCTYVCPSRLPLLAGIRQLRQRAATGAADSE
jgi:electron transport complex protein RnfC